MRRFITALFCATACIIVQGADVKRDIEPGKQKTFFDDGPSAVVSKKYRFQRPQDYSFAGGQYSRASRHIKRTPSDPVRLVPEAAEFSVEFTTTLQSTTSFWGDFWGRLSPKGGGNGSGNGVARDDWWKQKARSGKAYRFVPENIFILGRTETKEGPRKAPVKLMDGQTAESTKTYHIKLDNGLKTHFSVSTTSGTTYEIAAKKKLTGSGQGCFRAWLVINKQLVDIARGQLWAVYPDLVIGSLDEKAEAKGGFYLDHEEKNIKMLYGWAPKNSYPPLSADIVFRTTRESGDKGDVTVAGDKGAVRLGAQISPKNQSKNYWFSGKTAGNCRLWFDIYPRDPESGKPANDPFSDWVELHVVEAKAPASVYASARGLAAARTVKVVAKGAYGKGAKVFWSVKTTNNGPQFDGKPKVTNKSGRKHLTSTAEFTTKNGTAGGTATAELRLRTKNGPVIATTTINVIDIALDTNLGIAKQTDAHKLNPGAVVVLNDNDSNGNHRPDIQDNQAAVNNEVDLKPFTITGETLKSIPNGAVIRLIRKSNALEIYRAQTKGQGNRQLANNDNDFEWTFPRDRAAFEAFARGFYVEGAIGSNTPRDNSLTLQYDIGGQTVTCDVVNTTVIDIAMDFMQTYTDLAMQPRNMLNADVNVLPNPSVIIRKTAASATVRNAPNLRVSSSSLDPTKTAWANTSDFIEWRVVAGESKGAVEFIRPANTPRTSAVGKSVHAYGTKDGRVVIGIAPKGSGPKGGFQPFIRYHSLVGPMITYPVRFNYIIVRTQNNQVLRHALPANGIPNVVRTANQFLFQVGAQYELDNTNNVHLPFGVLASATNRAKAPRRLFLTAMSLPPQLPVTIISADGRRRENHTIVLVRRRTFEVVLAEDLQQDFGKGARVVTRVQARTTAAGVWEIRGLPEQYCNEVQYAHGTFDLILNGRPGGINYSLVHSQNFIERRLYGSRAIAYAGTHPVNSVVGNNGGRHESTAENGIKYRMNVGGLLDRYGVSNTAGVLCFDSYWNRQNHLVAAPSMRSAVPFASVTAHEVGHCGRLRHRITHDNRIQDGVLMLDDIPLVAVPQNDADNEQNIMWPTALQDAIDFDLIQAEVFRGMFQQQGGQQ